MPEDDLPKTREELYEAFDIPETWINYCPTCGHSLEETDHDALGVWFDWDRRERRAQIRCPDCGAVNDVSHRRGPTVDREKIREHTERRTDPGLQ